ncbi:hypothetical protein ACLOJK_040674 [Asimina triloba]
MFVGDAGGGHRRCRWWGRKWWASKMQVVGTQVVGIEDAGGGDADGGGRSRGRRSSGMQDVGDLGGPRCKLSRMLVDEDTGHHECWWMGLQVVRGRRRTRTQVVGVVGRLGCF